MVLALESVDAQSLQIPQEAETFMHKLLTGPQVEQLLCERGDPAVCVEDGLTDLHNAGAHSVNQRQFLNYCLSPLYIMYL